MEINTEAVSSKEMSVVMAFSIDVGATFLCQVSYVVMKLAHVDADKYHKTAYCSWKFSVGLICLLLGGIIHLVVLPFLPLVLVATNSATAIVMSAILSVQCLQERMVWAYDLSAFFLISGGTTAMVLLSRETEAKLTTEIIAGQLKSIQAISFFAFYIIFAVLNYMLTRWFTGQIRLFER